MPIESEFTLQFDLTTYVIFFQFGKKKSIFLTGHVEWQMNCSKILWYATLVWFIVLEYLMLGNGLTFFLS